MLAKTVTTIVIVVIVAAAALGAGAALGYELRGGPTPAQVESSTLSILAAGSLTGQFPELASLLVNETPGISAPTATQTYEGSLDVVNAFTTSHQSADVAAVADFRIIPQMLEPTYANFEVVFGATPEVLAYDPSLPALDGINATNWGPVLANAIANESAPKFAVWNASSDPNGYNEIFTMELQGELFAGGPLAVYHSFYEGSPTSLVKPNPATTIPEHESSAAELLSTGTVSALITYRSYAVANHLTFVTLNSTVGLAATDPTSLADYAALTTTLLTASGGDTTVSAAPVLFAITVPTGGWAPNAALGDAFVHLLLSPQGSAILAKGGAFAPIFPGWVQTSAGASIPSELAPDVTAPPAWANALLT